MRRLAIPFLGLFLGAGCTAAPQEHPADVTFQLRLKAGKATYRIGERIPIELLFSSTTPDTYQVDPGHKAPLPGTARPPRVRKKELRA